MRLLIMGRKTASEYIPEESTYVIRICYGNVKNPIYWLGGSLKRPDLCQEHIYEFDDVGYTPIEGTVRFTEELARKIITDFMQRNQATTLLVHCSRGKNRSPSIGISLNDLFLLGENSELLKRTYPEYNEWIYGMMMETGRKMGLPK